MKKKVVNICNVDDKKSTKGFWVKSYTESTEDSQVIYLTRGGILWNSVVARCNESGSHRKDRPTYKDCENNFKDFDTFVDWCLEQQGYMLKEDSGRFWSLDKDILVPCNKIYSPDTCMFVPNRINNIFYSKKRDSDLPLGVTKRPNESCFRYSCSDIYLDINGKGETALDAHKGWQKAKINILTSLIQIESYSDRLRAALTSRLEMLIYEFENDIQTKW